MSDLAYLQYVRSGVLAAIAPQRDPESADIAQHYHSRLARFVDALASLLAAGAKPEAVALVPSTRALAEPYFVAIKERMQPGTELTPYIRRLGGVRAGLTADFAAILADTEYTGPSLGAVQSLLLVDDVLQSGRTVAAVLERLTNAGLMSTAKLSVACPLRVFGTEQPGTWVTVPG